MAALPQKIRDEREKAGLTQRDVAEKLDWSVSKVIRLEQGQTSLKVTDVRAMLQLFGINDPERVAEMVTLAREELRHRREHPPTIVKVITFTIEAANDAHAAALTDALVRAAGGRPHKVMIKDVLRYS